MPGPVANNLTLDPKCVYGLMAGPFSAEGVGFGNVNECIKLVRALSCHGPPLLILGCGLASICM